MVFLCYATQMIIYKAVAPNGKAYIGQTIFALDVRRAKHYCERRSFPFANALRKYGAAMKWSVIDTADSLDELNRKEAKWIAELNTIAPHGYNATAGGDCAKASAASRAKMSAKAMGRKSPKGMRGKKHTAETKARIAAKMIGNKNPQKKAII